MAQTLYWTVYLDSVADYADSDTDAAKIVAGQDSTGASLPAGQYGSQAFSGGTATVDASSAASGLPAGTAYRIAWTIYDGSVYGGGSSTKTVFSAAFSTLTNTVLVVTGSSGTFSGTGSSPATATLAATGGAGTFSGAANSTTTATLAATGGAGTFSGATSSPATAALAATGGAGTFAGAASTTATATLAATGGAGTFSGTANSPATAAVSATGGGGTFAGSAGTGVSLAATGGSGAFSGTTNSPATASLAATGGAGAFSGTAGPPASVALDSTGGGGTFSGSASVPTNATRIGGPRRKYKNIDFKRLKKRRKDDDDTQAPDKASADAPESVPALAAGLPAPPQPQRQDPPAPIAAPTLSISSIIDEMVRSAVPVAPLAGDDTAEPDDPPEDEEALPTPPADDPLPPPPVADAVRDLEASLRDQIDDLKSMTTTLVDIVLEMRREHSRSISALGQSVDELRRENKRMGIALENQRRTMLLLQELRDPV